MSYGPKGVAFLNVVREIGWISVNWKQCRFLVNTVMNLRAP
jgi:hypothetical protein